MAEHEKLFWYFFLTSFIVILMMGFANPAMFAQSFGESAYVIKIKSFGFVPMFLVVNSGSTITWVNEAGIAQILVVNGAFSPQLVGPGTNWSFKFNRPGVYEYRTTELVGILVVD